MAYWVLGAYKRSGLVSFCLAAVMPAVILGFTALPARADVIAPMSAARVEGSFGSDWHDRQLLRNPTDNALSGRIVLTPRGQEYIEAIDPTFTFSIPANTTLVLEDLHEQLQPGVAGAGTLRLIPDDGQQAPLWRATMFNRVDESEFGAQAFSFDPEADGYHTVGSTLGTILSSEGYRDNPFVQSGPEGVTGTWVYANSAGGDTAEVPLMLGPNTTFQFTGGVRQLLGFDPEGASQLDFVVEEGSARAYLTRNNNASSDPAYDELEVTSILPSDDVALLYVNRWLPSNESKFYLSNTETRAMINGGTGSRSYARDMAEIIYPEYAGAFDSVEQVETWILSQVNGVASGESEITSDIDPFLWDNDAQGEPGVVFYQEIPPGSLNSLNLNSLGMQSMYELVKGISSSGEEVDGFLVNYTRNNPSHYGGELGGVPDMDVNPTWNMQDPN